MQTETKFNLSRKQSDFLKPFNVSESSINIASKKY